MQAYPYRYLQYLLDKKKADRNRFQGSATNADFIKGRSDSLDFQYLLYSLGNCSGYKN